MGEIRAYENLAQAIILYAVSDYRAAKKRLRKFPDDRDAFFTTREVRRFFLSAYFRNLTNLNGEVVLKQLQEEADEL